MTESVSRTLVLAAMAVACKGEPAPTPPQPDNVTKSAPPKPKGKLTVTSSDPAIVIDQVEVLRVGNAGTGVFEVHYHVKRGVEKASVPVRITCRVHDYNLVTNQLDFGEVPNDEANLTSMYRPDPFELAPNVCQIEWLKLVTKPGDITLNLGGTKIATACYRDGKVIDGACTPDELKPRLMSPGFTVEMHDAKLQERPVAEMSLAASALFTVGASPAEGRVYRRVLTCKDAKGKTHVGEDQSGDAFTPLSRLPAGTTIYAHRSSFPMSALGQTKPAQCELAVVSRPADAKDGDRTKDEVMGMACLTWEKMTPGGCK